MSGEEFYQHLRKVYQRDGQKLYDNYVFYRWLPKQDGTNSFQFHGNNPKKSVPKIWLVDAKNAMNEGIVIHRNWFNEHFDNQNFNDCRASIALWLLNNY